MRKWIRQRDLVCLKERIDNLVSTMAWCRALKRDVHALYLASRDPRVPWYAKAIAACVAAYALSPIDLIPDFVLVLGYLDDLIIVPLGIALAVRLVPADVLAEHRTAAALVAERPTSKTAAALIVATWMIAIGLSSWAAWRYFSN